MKSTNGLCAFQKHIPPATVSKQLVKTSYYTQPATTPSSRNSISTCFQSDELQDVHIPTEQSIVHLLSRDVSDRSMELSSDGNPEDYLSENDPTMASKDGYRKIKDEDIDLQKLQAEKPAPHKSENIFSFFVLSPTPMQKVKNSHTPFFKCYNVCTSVNPCKSKN